MVARARLAHRRQAGTPALLSLTLGGASAQPSSPQPDMEFIADLYPRSIRNCAAVAGVDDDRIAAFEDTQR